MAKNRFLETAIFENMSISPIHLLSEAQQKKYLKRQKYLFGGGGLISSSSIEHDAGVSRCTRYLPFVIFASESAVDQLADGSRVVNVVQDNDQRYV